MQKKIKFGTDGIRGRANQFPFRKKFLNWLGLAIAQWSVEKYKTKNPRVLIGHDTRISCNKIKKSLKDGLMAIPLTIIDGKVLPTPAICKLVKTNEFDLGIVISASHNPYKDNGIKIFDSKQCKISQSDEDIIIKNFEKLQRNNHEVIINSKSSEKIWENAYEQYITEILKLFKNDFLKKLKIVIDCANGATYKVAPILFKKLGAQVIELSTQPNGKNINKESGALYPELLQQKILEHKADIGFAFDGDGDRVIIINKSGQIKDGDDILALLCHHKEFLHSQKIIGTIMTNLGLELFLKKNKKHLVRTDVGDKYIAEHLQQENLPLGGEASGHIIIKNYMNTGDGIFNALKILETIIQNKNWNLTTFKKTPQYLVNIPVANKADLSQPPYSQIIKEYKNLLKNGRVVVRYSGTENLLRVMTEAEKKLIAQNIAQNLAQKLKVMLNN
ncbi:phosphoglucosamine mutase [Candidatus Dependentiae bacterium]